MAAEKYMPRMFFCFVWLTSINHVVAKFCLNSECSEPIASARIKIPFQTKDVHLYTGDEIDILSKSDDGSQMEFEIGDVKGIIPTENLKEKSLQINEHNLIHVPEFENGDGDEDSSHYNGEGEEFDENEDFDNPDVDEIPIDYISQETEKVKKKPRMKLHKLAGGKKIPLVPPKKDSNMKAEEGIDKLEYSFKADGLEMPKKEDRMESQVNAKEGVFSGHQIGEALAPGSQAKAEEDGKNSTDSPKTETFSQFGKQNNLQRIEKAASTPIISSQSSEAFNSEIFKLENYRIMKKRYVQDYMDSNYAGKKLDENTIKNVESFIENDMLEQLKEPDSELLQMLLHYDAKDLPGGNTAEESAKEILESSREEEKAGVKEGTIGDAIEVNVIKTDSNAILEHDKENIKTEETEEEERKPHTNPDVASEGKNDAITDRQREGDGKDNESSEEFLNGDASSQSEVKRELEASSERSGNHESVKIESAKDSDTHLKDTGEITFKEDFKQHPNFELLKKKYVESYLKTHYSNEKVDPHIMLMVENLISSDLVQQLQAADSNVRDELLRLNPDELGESIAKKEIPETAEVGMKPNDTQRDTPSSETAASTAQDNLMKFKIVADNIIQGNEISNKDLEAPSVTELQSEDTEDYSKPPEETMKTSETVPKETYERIVTEPKPETSVDIDHYDKNDQHGNIKGESSTGSEPIPPSGGKDSKNQVTEVKLEEGLYQRETEERSSRESTDDLDRTQEDKSKIEEEENSSTFSFGQLGSVLKDRFQLFASKIVSNEGLMKDSEEESKNNVDEEPRNSAIESDTDNVKDPNIAELETISLADMMREADTEVEKIAQKQTDKRDVVPVNTEKSVEEQSEKEDIVPVDTEEQSEKQDKVPGTAEETGKENSSLSEAEFAMERKTGDNTKQDLEWKEGVQNAKQDESNLLDSETTKILHGSTETLPDKGDYTELDVEKDGVSNKNTKQEIHQTIPDDKGTTKPVESPETNLDRKEEGDSIVIRDLEKEEEVTNLQQQINTIVQSVRTTEEHSGSKKEKSLIEEDRDSNIGINEESKEEMQNLEQKVDLVTLSTNVVLAGSQNSSESGMKSPVDDDRHFAEEATKHDSAMQDNVKRRLEDQGSHVKSEDQPDSQQEKLVDTVPFDADSSVNVVMENGSTEKHSVGSSKTSPEFFEETDQVTKDTVKNIESLDENSRDMLLESCHSQPSLPACEALRGAKIFRSSSHKVSHQEQPDTEEEVGRLSRAWRNLMKIMKRIKLMKLGFVRLFHGPLSVMGLEDISHWIHEQVEHASPEVITIAVCCFLLIIALALKSIFTTKHVTVGASAYDVHKMRQSKQRILQENTEDMVEQVKKLEEVLKSKQAKIDSGEQVSKELKNRLNLLQKEFDEQENQYEDPLLQSISSVLRSKRSTSKHTQSSPSIQSSEAARRKHSNTLLENIRDELDKGKSQQNRLQQVIEEKEQEIHEADSMALRHQNEIERQKEISEALNSRLEKVVDELDLKDGIVLELQQKIGTLHIELENVEKERRELDTEKRELKEKFKAMEEELKQKEEENGKLQDEIDEKENEIEVLRDCMAQINNGKLDGEAIEDFDTPEEDPDIKEQLKTERLKQIVESTQAIANLKKSEKEKEYFQEGYLEELEKREQAEEHVKTLKAEMEKLSKEVVTYKTSSAEYRIKLDTLQQYFKQQETELHRKLSVEEQSRLDFQRKYEEIIGESKSAHEETSVVKSQNEDLKKEIKEMERSIRDLKQASEKDSHDLWIKNRQANRDLEEMKRERDIYRKRLLEAETAKKRAASPQLSNTEKSRDSPAGSDDGRPVSPGSQKSNASGVPNFMVPTPMFPPPPPMFPPMRMPIGPMPPQPVPYGPLPPIRRPRIPIPGQSSITGALPMASTGQLTGPPVGPPPRPSGIPSGLPGGFSSGPPSQYNPMGHPAQYNVPTTGDFQNNPGMPPSSNAIISSTCTPQFPNQQPVDTIHQNQPLTRNDSQKSLGSTSSRQQGQGTPTMQRRSQSQGPLQSTPVNSPSVSKTAQLPPPHPSLLGPQPNQFARPQLTRRTTGGDVA